MKIESNTKSEKKPFQPFSVTVTFETREEYEAIVDFMGYDVSIPADYESRLNDCGYDHQENARKRNVARHFMGEFNEVMTVTNMKVNG